MLGIRLPQEVERRLTNLARKTGRTKSYYAKKAIVTFLEAQEELLLRAAGSFTGTTEPDKRRVEHR